MYDPKCDTPIVECLTPQTPGYRRGNLHISRNNWRAPLPVTCINYLIGLQRPGGRFAVPIVSVSCLVRIILVGPRLHFIAERQVHARNGLTRRILDLVTKHFGTLLCSLTKGAHSDQHRLWTLKIRCPPRFTQDRLQHMVHCVPPKWHMTRLL